MTPEQIDRLRNIPLELQRLRQWVVWQYEETEDGKKPTKVPYTPGYKHASVTDASTWCSFEEVLAAAPRFAGIGFVFTPADPYGAIDIDALSSILSQEEREKLLAVQGRVYHTFDSYTERSPSGQGYHIIIRATLPSGRKRGGIELYSQNRFFTFTGDVVRGSPIQDYQGIADVLYKQLGGHIETYYYDGDAAETKTDQEVIDQALGAVNGEKFARLLTSDDWRQEYASDQSRADFAFIDIIAFYTQNRQQIKRIFRNSPLGKRQKAKREDYVDMMINRSFDRMLPPLDMDGLYNAIEEQKAEIAAENAKAEQAAAAAAHASATKPGHETLIEPPLYPRGLMGDIARFVYSASPRPVHEVSLVAAIGLMAGMCGRSYNISGTGVNLYTLLLGPTGIGKEAMSGGISKLVASVVRMDGTNIATPSMAKFIGPSFIASAQGLQKELSQQPSFLSIIGEFGIRMAALCHPRASSNDLNLKALLLELYHKSGRNDLLGKMSYADKEKNTAAIQAPAFSLLAESTPHTFLKIVDEDLVLSGLLPRFLIVEYKGKRGDLQAGHEMVVPSFELIDKLGNLAVQCHALSGTGQPINVGKDERAQWLTDDFDRYATGQINAAQSEVARELWNRAHIKLLRLSALIAIGANPLAPVIIEEDIAFAFRLIKADIDSMTRRFELGEVGANFDHADNMAQLKDLYEKITDFHNKPLSFLAKYHVSEAAYEHKLIGRAYLQQRLYGVKSYRTDKRGQRAALDNAIKDALSAGLIEQVAPKQVKELVGTAGEYYVLRNLRWGMLAGKS